MVTVAHILRRHQRVVPDDETAPVLAIPFRSHFAIFGFLLGTIGSLLIALNLWAFSNVSVFHHSKPAPLQHEFDGARAKSVVDTFLRDIQTGQTTKACKLLSTTFLTGSYGGLKTCAISLLDLRSLTFKFFGKPASLEGKAIVHVLVDGQNATFYVLTAERRIDSIG